MVEKISYAPWLCDLCGSGNYETLLHLETGRAMRSDRHLLAMNLHKLRCLRCGLVRSGSVFESLETLYTQDYSLSVVPEEHYFYRDGQAVSRSDVLRDWLVDVGDAAPWQKAIRCLEIGAGSGRLIESFQAWFPETQFDGLELSAGAVEQAQARGLTVQQGAPESFAGEGYDIVYVIAVIEHVPSPMAFLQHISRFLKPGGLLYFSQPTQDAESYDLFFADHLHHFASAHLRHYAQRTGFQEVGLKVGHPLMPNFSLHIWRKAPELTQPGQWQGQALHTHCETSARQIQADMQGLNTHLAALKQQEKPVALFGLHEVYWLCRAYSDLGDITPDFGLDDRPNKSEYAQFDFSVIHPDDAPTHNLDNIILTMNKLYYPQVKERLEKAGIQAYGVLH